MQDTVATSRQLAERAAKPRRGGPSRLQTVGDYAGQLAGEAAQAVRRTGLKPGLERSFGFTPELRGQIVAQEPQGGSELARNGLVTLYVAAPGSAPLDEQDAAVPRAGERPEAETSVRRLARAEPASDRAGAGPRRRKSRRSPGARGPALDPPPPPRLPTVDQTAERAQAPEPNDTRAWPAAVGSSLDAPDHGEAEGDELTEEYVIQADELFAGHAGANAPAWRRVYPRRRRGVRAPLAERPRLVVAALVLLGVWLVVAGAAALIGHRARPHRPTAALGHVRVPAPVRRRASTATRSRPSARRMSTPGRHAGRRRQQPAPERRLARRPPVERAALQAPHADSEPVAPTPTPAAAASREFGPAQREVKRRLHSPWASPTNTRR
jgi:hypothetical protein